MPRKERVSAHLVNLLVLHPLLEAVSHSTKVSPEEDGDGDGHHWECDLPEQDIGSTVDGPHEVKVHTLGKRFGLDRDRRESGGRGRTK